MNKTKMTDEYRAEQAKLANFQLPRGTELRWPAVSGAVSRLEEFWLPKGYVSVRLAAETLNRSINAIYRAIEAGSLEVKMDGRFRFVSVRSLACWLGADAAKEYGILVPKAGA